MVLGNSADDTIRSGSQIANYHYPLFHPFVTININTVDIVLTRLLFQNLVRILFSFTYSPLSNKVV